MSCFTSQGCASAESETIHWDILYVQFGINMIWPLLLDDHLRVHKLDYC